MRPRPRCLVNRSYRRTNKSSLSLSLSLSGDERVCRPGSTSSTAPLRAETRAADKLACEAKRQPFLHLLVASFSRGGPFALRGLRSWLEDYLETPYIRQLCAVSLRCARISEGEREDFPLSQLPLVEGYLDSEKFHV